MSYIRMKLSKKEKSYARVSVMIYDIKFKLS